MAHDVSKRGVPAEAGGAPSGGASTETAQCICHHLRREPSRLVEQQFGSLSERTIIHVAEKVRYLVLRHELSPSAVVRPVDGKHVCELAELHFGMRSVREEVVEKLVEREADVGLDPDGTLPLAQAARCTPLVVSELVKLPTATAEMTNRIGGPGSSAGVLIVDQFSISV